MNLIKHHRWLSEAIEQHPLSVFVWTFGCVYKSTESGLVTQRPLVHAQRLQPDQFYSGRVPKCLSTVFSFLFSQKKKTFKLQLDVELKGEWKRSGLLIAFQTWTPGRLFIKEDVIKAVWVRVGGRVNGGRRGAFGKRTGGAAKPIS